MPVLRQAFTRCIAMVLVPALFLRLPVALALLVKDAGLLLSRRVRAAVSSVIHVSEPPGTSLQPGRRTHPGRP